MFSICVGQRLRTSATSICNRYMRPVYMFSICVGQRLRTSATRSLGTPDQFLLSRKWDSCISYTDINISHFCVLVCEQKNRYILTQLYLHACILSWRAIRASGCDYKIIKLVERPLCPLSDCLFWLSKCQFFLHFSINVNYLSEKPTLLTLFPFYFSIDVYS